MSHFECEHGHRVDNYLFFEREGKGQAYCRQCERYKAIKKVEDV